MKKHVYIIGGFGTLAIATVWWERNVTRRLEAMDKSLAQKEASSRATDQQVSSLASEGALTRSAVTSQFYQVVDDRARVPDAVPVAPPQQQSAEASEARPAPADPNAPDPMTQRVLSNLSSSFDSEVVDRSWAPDAASTLREKAAGLLAQNSDIQSLECRTTMCRLETIQPNMTQYQAFGLEFGKLAAFPQMFLTKTAETPDGRLKMTMYLGKSGTQLPYGDTKL